MRIAGGAKKAAIVAAGGLMAMPAAAAPWLFDGSATLSGGVDSNPFLQVPSRGATGVIGGTLLGRATRRTERSSTVLLGSGDVSGYLSKYGRNRNLLASVTQTQRFAENLQGFASASYSNTINPQSNFGFDPAQQTTAVVDYLTIGTKTQRIDGNVALDWQATARDTFRIGALGSHATYSSAIASTTDQYGGNFSWLHRIDARTQAGVQLQATKISGGGYPSSTSYNAFLQVVRQLSEAWTFDGAFGLIKQHTTRAFGGSGDHTTFGFNGSLCGTYPRSNVCFTFARQAAPSGIGGLRTDMQFTVSGGYSLTEHSRVTLAAAYDKSTSRDSVLIPRQRFYTATGTYSRTLSPRLSVGATARYQHRVTRGNALFFPNSAPSEYGLTGNITYAFGRTSR